MSKEIAKINIQRHTLGAGFAMLLLAPVANAHHMMGGRVPETFTEGLLSGLAHPIIGLDHFAFLLVAVLLSFTLRGVARYAVPVAFVMATLAGTVFHLGEGDIPFVETLVSLTVLFAGLLAYTRKSPSALFLSGLFMVAGVLHGYAYGESIVGAENTPLFAYLVGFSLIQYAVIAGGIRGMELIARRSDALRVLTSRLASGVALLSGGVFLTLSLI